MFDTPVLLIIFNRPDNTGKVFEALRNAKPKKLFIVADGPREGKEDEKERCEQTRMIVTRVDWDCEVHTNFSNLNLGCKLRVSSGIDWVFEQVDEAIILEDDCLPHPSFFLYCDTMLERYRHDERIMHIAGINFQGPVKRGQASYYFSKYTHIWGWATWKRAWNYYDVSLNEWPSFKQSKQFKDWCFSEAEESFWGNALENVHNGKIDTWDYQWFFAVVKNNGYAIMPNVNLVSNIGFRADATHTHEYNPKVADLPTCPYLFPDIISDVAINREADDYTRRNVFNILAGNDDGSKESIFSVLKSKLSGMFNQ